MSALSRSRLAVSAAFAINGFIVATWVSRIPAAQAKLQISPGVLGLVLLGTAAGSLVAMPASGWLIAHRGSRTLVQATTVLLCATLLPIAAANSAVELAGALLLFGMAAGSQNVSMNTHAVSTEEACERPLMGSFHAMWSLGAMAGSATGGWAASLSYDLPTHFAFSAALTAASSLALLGGLHRPDHAANFSQLNFRIPLPVAGLGLIGFAVSVAEGSVADWSALYLKTVIGSESGAAALGFSAYSAAMVVSRLLADRTTALVGRACIVRGGSLIAFCGLAITIGSRSYFPAVLGFAIAGLGVATIIPNVFGAAGRVDGLPAGVGMAAVTTASYMGFLGGPPAIGGLAQSFGLRNALCFVLLCLLVAAGSSRFISRSESLHAVPNLH